MGLLGQDGPDQKTVERGPCSVVSNHISHTLIGLEMATLDTCRKVAKTNINYRKAGHMKDYVSAFKSSYTSDEKLHQSRGSCVLPGPGLQLSKHS
jgi:hypothetical protein